MSLIIKGVNIPIKRRALHMLGSYVDKLVIDGIEVWKVKVYKSVYDIDGNFTVPVGATAVTICGVAGGGGGSSLTNLGGSSGQVADRLSVQVTPGDIIPITIGAGGTENAPGEATTFGALLNLAGGTQGDYEGDLVKRDTCGGINLDGTKVGLYFGGQAGAFGNGGDGEGNKGTGGGGGGSGVVGGTGGRGKMIVTWEI